jgi:hypothetical protein
MFQGVDRPIERILSITRIEKSDIAKFACDVPSRRMTLRTNNLPSEQKKRLG